MNHTSTPRGTGIGSLLLCCIAALAISSCVNNRNEKRPPRPLPPAGALSADTHNRSAPVPAEQSIVDAAQAVDAGEAAAPDPAPPPPANHNHLSSAAPAFVVQAGKSRLVELDRPVRRVSVGNPEVADIILVSPKDILINGRHAGDTSLIFWDQHGVSEVHTITVEEFSERQVLLEVTIAELNRTAMEAHGVDYRVLRSDLRWV